ncbi:hypothetical protein CEXT_483221 [Caerostris extrusa]|uniref:Uncharacterized protein n=1 Tax=Caerostris extrusa TaxID=172846 RepID=A0AAV4Y3W1_CAEEX|nr:hypothetical protein CEXT_483221 [Caerostris extrusa]
MSVSHQFARPRKALAAFFCRTFRYPRVLTRETAETLKEKRRNSLSRKRPFITCPVTALQAIRNATSLVIRFEREGNEFIEDDNSFHDCNKSKNRLTGNLVESVDESLQRWLSCKGVRVTIRK